MTTPKSLFEKPFAKGDWSSLERPRFSPGLLLEDEDLNLGVDYTRQMMRLMLKSLFGCGVICGLQVTAVPTCKGRKRRIDVAKGSGVSCHGDLIEVTRPWSHEFGDDCDGEFPDYVWVVLCYKEKCCRPREAGCSADEKSQSSHTRVRAGYDIKLYSTLPSCACRCGNGPVEAETSISTSDGCCDDPTPPPTEGASGEEDESKKDPCRCYDDHLLGICGCDHGCDCVVLGLVMPNEIAKGDEEDPKDDVVKVDSSMVRRIRPLLNGWYFCLDRKTSTQQATGQAKIGGIRQQLGDHLGAQLERKAVTKEKAAGTQGRKK